MISLSNIDSISRFSSIFPSGKVLVDEQGNWQEASGICRTVQYYFQSKDETVKRVGKLFCRLLDQVECDYPIVKAGPNEVPLQALQSAEKVLDTLAQTARHRLLKRRVIALRYRLGEELHKPGDGRLSDLAANWKARQLLFQKMPITEEDRDVLREVERYDAFVDLLLEDRFLREDFFKWCLRDHNDWHVFIQFPKTQTRIKNAHLAGRIARFGRTTFSIKEGKKKYPFLTFQLEKRQKKVSLLNEKSLLTVRGGLQRTVGEILDVFQRKNEKIGDFEMINGRICNWNCHELGYLLPDGSYRRVDLDLPDWYKQLPVFETIDKEEVHRRCGVEPDKDQWLLNVRSTREGTNLDFDRTHGYEELIVPNGNGDYLVYYFGKFAAAFPTTSLEKLLFITDTVISRISYPDENTFYAHRQQGVIPHAISSEQGERVMELRRLDMQRARFKNVVFQFAWENCAYLAQTDLDKVTDGSARNYFKVRLMENDPQGPLKVLFQFVRLFPKRLEDSLALIITFLLGAWRKLAVEEDGEKVIKSVWWTSGFREKCQIYSPGNLHRLIQTGEVRGKITFGHGKQNAIEVDDALYTEDRR